jgi:hypothetical protein
MPGNGGENTRQPDRLGRRSRRCARRSRRASSSTRSPWLTRSRHASPRAWRTSPAPALSCGAHVLEHRLLTVRSDDRHLHGSGLAEPPAAADGLVVGLVRVGEADEHHPGAVLPVQPPAADPRLRDEHPRVAVREREQPRLLLVRAVGAAYFDRVRDRARERLRLRVQVAPDDARPVVRVDDLGGEVDALRQRLAPRLRRSCIVDTGTANSRSSDTASASTVTTSTSSGGSVEPVAS